MGIALPEGAATINQSTTVTEEAKNTEEAEKSYLQRLKELPGNLYEAYTGENVPIEFPNIPEATDMGGDAPGFIEGLLPNLKIMLARDDVGKTEIMKNSFEGDERWGGAFSDKFGNPMIVWNDQPYYVNKPGFSGQDFGTFVGEVIKFAPAMKFVNKAKTVLGTAGRGAGAYSTTELGSQALESAMTPETTKLKDQTTSDLAKDVGISTTIGVGADLVVPGVAKGVTKGVKAGANVVSDATKMFPRFNPETSIKSKFALTQGQRTAELPDVKKGSIQSKVTQQLEEEDVLRNAPSTNPLASNIIKGFDESQLTAIRNEADLLRKEFGSGRVDIVDADDIPTAVGEEIQTSVTKTATSLKDRAGKAYEVVKGAEFQPVMSREGVLETTNNALNSVLSKDGLGITQRELADMKILNRELEYLKRINNLAQKPNFKGSPLNILSGYQKSLNRAFRSAEEGSPEQLALGRIKGEVDKAVFEGIEKGIITGDEAVLDSLKEATDLYRQYIGLTGKAGGKDSQEKAANRILQMITNPNYTPKQVVTAFFGHAKFNPNQSMGLVLNKLKNVLPEEQYQEVVALAKDAVLEKAFSGTGKSGVTRTNIVNNYDDVFVKNKAITSLLFNADEIKRIKQFRDDVMPTLWADIKLNPSNSGYTILSGMARNGLLNYARLVPIVGTEFVEGVQRIGSTAQAINATRQYLNRVNKPLFSATVQSSIRPVAVEADDEVESSTLQSIIQNAPASLKEKLLEGSDAQ